MTGRAAWRGRLHNLLITPLTSDRHHRSRLTAPAPHAMLQGGLASKTLERSILIALPASSGRVRVCPVRLLLFTGSPLAYPTGSSSGSAAPTLASYGEAGRCRKPSRSRGLAPCFARGVYLAPWNATPYPQGIPAFGRHALDCRGPAVDPHYREAATEHPRDDGIPPRRPAPVGGFHRRCSSHPRQAVGVAQSDGLARTRFFQLVPHRSPVVHRSAAGPQSLLPFAPRPARLTLGFVCCFDKITVQAGVRPWLKDPEIAQRLPALLLRTFPTE